MTVTRDEAALIVKLLNEGLAAGLSVPDALMPVRIGMPHVTGDDIRQILDTLVEETDIDRVDYEAMAKAMRNLVAMINGAERLSGQADMTTGEAADFLKPRAANGDQEAKDLLAAVDDPFLRD